MATFFRFRLRALGFGIRAWNCRRLFGWLVSHDPGGPSRHTGPGVEDPMDHRPVRKDGDDPDNGFHIVKGPDDEKNNFGPDWFVGFNLAPVVENALAGWFK